VTTRTKSYRILNLVDHFEREMGEEGRKERRQLRVPSYVRKIGREVASLEYCRLLIVEGSI